MRLERQTCGSGLLQRMVRPTPQPTERRWPRPTREAESLRGVCAECTSGKSCRERGSGPCGQGRRTATCRSLAKMPNRGRVCLINDHRTGVRLRQNYSTRLRPLGVLHDERYSSERHGFGGNRQALPRQAHWKLIPQSAPPLASLVMSCLLIPWRHLFTRFFRSLDWMRLHDRVFNMPSDFGRL